MRGFIVEQDGWTVDGEKITDSQKLAAIRAVIYERGPLILNHRFYRAARSPICLLFEEYSDFVEYLDTQPKVGDELEVWMFCDVCLPAKPLACGKYPDDQGRVLQGGAY